MALAGLIADLLSGPSLAGPTSISKSDQLASETAWPKTNRAEYMSVNVSAAPLLG